MRKIIILLIMLCSFSLVGCGKSANLPTTLEDLLVEIYKEDRNFEFKYEGFYNYSSSGKVVGNKRYEEKVTSAGIMKVYTEVLEGNTGFIYSYDYYDGWEKDPIEYCTTLLRGFDKQVLSKDDFLYKEDIDSYVIKPKLEEIIEGNLIIDLKSQIGVGVYFKHNSIPNLSGDYHLTSFGNSKITLPKVK